MTKEEAIKYIKYCMCMGRLVGNTKPIIDEKWQAGEMAIEALKQPTHKKGKWISNPNKMKGTEIECNKCGVSALSKIGIQVCSDFCPNCGADMRGEEV